MASYIIRRLFAGILVLFLLSITVFLLLRVLAGEPVVCPGFCDEAQIKQLKDELGLNDPYPVQYAAWLKDLATGHLGRGALDQKPVMETLQHRMPVTLELVIMTVIFTVAIGVPFGVISALYRNSVVDYGVRLLSVLGLAIPSFWLATLVIAWPAMWWGYAPSLGRPISFFGDPMGNLQQYAPTAAILAFGSAAGLMRLTRSALLDVLRTDYIRTARAKGLRDTMVVTRHAMKNALIPVVTVLGLQVTALLGGSVIIEQVFAINGIGTLILESLAQRQYQVTQSLALYVGACVVLINILVDVSYGWLDPRIRYR